MDLETELRGRLQGKVLVIGVGNTLRGDDAAGPEILTALEGKVKAHLLDVGEVPESYTGRILAEQADTIVLIDAADFGAAPGDVAVLEAEDLAGGSLSTHQLPLDLFFRYLRENSQAEIFAVGIQPAQLILGEPMSAPVASSVEALAQVLQNLLS